MSPAPPASPPALFPRAHERVLHEEKSLHPGLTCCDSLGQGRYFLVRDVTEKMDMLGTLGSCGAPNFRQVRGGLPVFGMGQPSLLGFRRVLQKLQKDGHKVSLLCPRLALDGKG